MSSNFSTPPPDPGTPARRPTSELWGEWGPLPAQPQPASAPPASPAHQDIHMEDTQPRPIIAPNSGAQASQAQSPTVPGLNPQAAFREHVTGTLPAFAPPSSNIQPPAAYAPYPGYAPQQGYADPYRGYPPNYPGATYPYPAYPGQSRYPGYPPYGGYQPYNGYAPQPWPVQPARPKRDNYLFGVGIAAFVCSCIIVLGGLASFALLALILLIPTNTTLGPAQLFASVMLFVAFGLAGVVGGGFGLYHSIRQAFFQKPSRDFALPPFWTFLLFYVVVLGFGLLLHTQNQDVTYPFLTGVLIILAGIFPALTVLALGDRRLHYPKKSRWPTTWRRFTLSLVGGATLSIVLASVLELVAEVVLVRSQNVNPLICVNRPDAPGCQNPAIYGVLLIIVAVIAPIVEESVKPISMFLLGPRLGSAAEAFVLGLACGIGFDLVETTGYISSGYTDWLNIAFVRSGAGLLHGFGAAMVGLGWYYITHPPQKRFSRGLLIAAGCWLYAVLQHALWNGTWGLTLLPGSAGQFFQTWSLNLGPISITAYELINIGQVILMIIFFIYMTGRVRKLKPPTTEASTSDVQLKNNAPAPGQLQRALP